MDPIFLDFFRDILAAHPDITTILALVGLLRAINKPLFALMRAYVAKTQSKKDDKLLEKIERSKHYKTFLFLLDWLGSVKPLADRKEKSEEK